jgi:hypothetical protein
VVTRDGDRFVDMTVGAIDMPDYAVTQAAGFGTIFFARLDSSCLKPACWV